MQTSEPEPLVPRGKPDEGRVTRSVRLRGPPREGRVTSTSWRVPRSLDGAVLGMGVLIAFFGGLAPDLGRFLLFLGGTIVVGAFAVWALVKIPIRPTFDRRWRLRPRIEPLDLEPWRDAARELSVEFVLDGGLPRIRGGANGIAFAVAYHQLGGSRTEAVATLPDPVPSELRAFPHRADFRTKDDRQTGDPEFDETWHVTSTDAESVRRRLSPESRRRLLAAAPDELHASGRTVTVTKAGYVTDAPRLVELARAAAAIAHG